MPPSTIASLNRSITAVEGHLQNFIVEERQDEIFGEDQEYTAETLKSGLEFLLSRILFLAKNFNELKNSRKFINYSLPADRAIFNTHLSEISSGFQNNDYDSIITSMDKIKLRLREYGFLITPEMFDDLDKRANEFNDFLSRGEENIHKTEKIRDKYEAFAEKLQEADTKIDALDNIINEQEVKLTEASSLLNKSQKLHQSMAQSHDYVENFKTNIEDFNKKIGEREQQLQQQKESTDSYQKKLEELEEEHQEKLKEAEKLINQARDALGYKTAEGISAAFNERYTAETKQGWKSFIWLTNAGAFVITGIGVGVWTLWDTTNSINLGVTISRIAIISIAISGAWFCAAQYVRHRNILEDYGYKSVLAKSMVAFLDQFKQPEEREHYLQTVLREIHKDPLRNKHDIDTPVSRVADIFTNKKKNDKPSEN